MLVAQKSAEDFVPFFELTTEPCLVTMIFVEVCTGVDVWLTKLVDP